MSAILKRMAGGLVFRGYYLSTISSSRLKSVKRKDSMQKKKDGFLKLYHNTWDKIAHLNLIEKLLYIYLISKQDRFGGGSFFMSDKYIMSELGISQRSLVRLKQSLVAKMPIHYKPGKYTKSMSEWHALQVERVPNVSREGAKIAKRGCQVGTTSNTDRRETDKKKTVVSQPIVNNITIVNTPERKLELDTMHEEAKRLLLTLETPSKTDPSRLANDREINPPK